MTGAATETRSVVVEREIPYPPEKIWRALTEPHLIEEWLMKTDFEPVVDHKFNLTGGWGAVDCQVLKVQPMRTLSYSWAAHGLESVVTWTLTPTSKGTKLRMEQAGFRPDQEQFYKGPKWAGGTSLPSWSRSWRGQIDAGPSHSCGFAEDLTCAFGI